MRWNSCGKLRIATGETVLYSGMDEGENHVRGVGFILSKRAAQCLLEWQLVSERIIRARFNSRWQQVTILQCYAPTNGATPGGGEGRFLRPATDGFGAGAMQRCEDRHGRYEC